ncbi:MerR family transcriptional regulator [Streptococcus parauberis]|uniref:MerR family transcriptional regulator n=2 Tax=Streptococcus parauberis TaxID=1348 RepID=A0A0E2UB42_9STRE|nr:MerR family transcriptional regulator [Streptococcus parauberis]AEF25988.1 putative transcriptional regulator [Streptococcus parauberis KCTC 11537]AUT05220.1 putative HTH-type transcriptional regulator [Streptococcus parauberis]EMG24906.1 Transcriptional regulator, MerR family [Streptococcus parauberis KRS-02083]MDT2732708.1 MerR family transcriptional regulator [Streptococcus parauberis]MDT2750057.1 MerR family transcriptional regulator [Streptococcus parauberis]
MYTIGEVSKLFNLPVSTLRYYDKEGFFPFLERTNGIRKFSETEIEALNIIECLKFAGLEIKDIKLFIDWCNQGPSTYRLRKELFKEKQAHLEEEMKQLEKYLAMVKFKSWYYDQAIIDGTEKKIQAKLPNNLPKDIQELYNLAHS